MVADRACPDSSAPTLDRGHLVVGRSLRRLTWPWDFGVSPSVESGRPCGVQAEMCPACLNAL